MEKTLTIRNSTVEFLIFQVQDKSQGVEVIYHDETIWATQKATSIDYNKDAPMTRLFYKRIQNKIHFAVHGHTAAELIIERANAEKEHMGLTTWENAPSGKIVKTDVSIAKNYLKEIVSRYSRPVVPV